MGMLQRVAHRRDFWDQWLKDFEDVFEGLNENSVSTNYDAPKNFSIPASDIREKDGTYFLAVDLPGVKKEQIDIEVDGKQITVKAERKHESQRGNEHFYRSERHHGYFKRVFRLPEEIDAKKIEAQYENGVLELAVPKSEITKAHKIKIGEGKTGLFRSLMGHGKEGVKEAINN